MRGVMQCLQRVLHEQIYADLGTCILTPNCQKTKFVSLQYLHSPALALLLSRREIQYFSDGTRTNSIFLILIGFIYFKLRTRIFLKVLHLFNCKICKNRVKIRCLVNHGFMCNHVSLKQCFC